MKYLDLMMRVFYGVAIKTRFQLLSPRTHSSIPPPVYTSSSFSQLCQATYISKGKSRNTVLIGE